MSYTYTNIFNHGYAKARDYTFAYHRQEMRIAVDQVANMVSPISHWLAENNIPPTAVQDISALCAALDKHLPELARHVEYFGRCWDDPRPKNVPDKGRKVIGPVDRVKHLWKHRNVSTEGKQISQSMIAANKSIKSALKKLVLDIKALPEGREPSSEIMNGLLETLKHSTEKINTNLRKIDHIEQDPDFMSAVENRSRQNFDRTMLAASGVGGIALTAVSAPVLYNALMNFQAGQARHGLILSGLGIVSTLCGTTLTTAPSWVDMDRSGLSAKARHFCTAAFLTASLAAGLYTTKKAIIMDLKQPRSAPQESQPQKRYPIEKHHEHII